MSFLRLYLEDDLRELVAGVPGHETFVWDMGSTSVRGFPHKLTHLIGVPKPSTEVTLTGRGGAETRSFLSKRPLRVPASPRRVTLNYSFCATLA